MTRIEGIFERLRVRFGTKVDQAWEGLDMAYVRADWGDVLDGVSDHSIQYALTNLPLQWPPTAGEFRELCRRAPAQVPLMSLPEPRLDPEIARRGLEQLRKVLANGIGEKDKRAWIARREALRGKSDPFVLAARAAIVEQAGQDDGSAEATRQAQDATSQQVARYMAEHPDLGPGWSRDRREAHQADLVRAGVIV